MKLTPIGRVFVDKGWDNYTLLELSGEDVLASGSGGQIRYVAAWLEGRREAWESDPEHDATLRTRVYAEPHQARENTFVVVSEVRLSA